MNVNIKVQGFGGVTAEDALVVFDKMVRPMFSDPRKVKVVGAEAVTAQLTMGSDEERVIDWIIKARVDG